MKTTNQNYTTSPRSKRRGFIRLGLLCFLSILIAPIHSYAQHQFNTKTSEPYEYQLVNGKKQKTRTVKNGGRLNLEVTFYYRDINGRGQPWLPLAGRTVVLSIANKQGPANKPVRYPVVTDAKGTATINLPFGPFSPMRNNLNRRYFWFFEGDTQFRKTGGDDQVVIVP